MLYKPKKTMTKFDEFIARKKLEYGSKFNTSDLADKFIPYYNSQQRIKVKFSFGEIKSGTVEITTGWQPVFILLLTRRSRGSHWTLDDKDEIIAVKG